jgi:hypothetical protein
MMAWLRRMLHRPPFDPTVAETRPAHVRTLARADRLLRLLAEYRAADAKRHR